MATDNAKVWDEILECWVSRPQSGPLFGVLDSDGRLIGCGSTRVRANETALRLGLRATGRIVEL